MTQWEITTCGGCSDRQLKKAFISKNGVGCGAVGCGTVLQAGLDSAPNRNKYQEYVLGGKGGRCVGLTTLPLSCADCLEIWEPQPHGTLTIMKYHINTVEVTRFFKYIFKILQDQPPPRQNS